MKLLHSVTKSKAAFLMSADKLFRNSFGVYFWTFTFKECLHDFQATRYWKDFSRELQNKFGRTVCGLRVTEVHPAEYSHGLHFHCLLNRRLNVHIVRKIAARHGIGHMFVKKATADTAFYLSKYIVKENDLSKGMRKWGAVGGFRQVKVKNIEVDSMFSQNIKWCQSKLKMRQMSYAFFLHVSKQTLIHGEIQNWPIKTVNTINIRTAKAQKVREIQETGLNVPDDDGVTYYDLHPLKTRFDRLHRVTIKTEYGWTEVLVPMPVNPEREPF